MTSDIVPQQKDPPLVAPVAEDPATVYLAGLSKGSRRTMLNSLDTIARLASSNALDSHSFPWHELKPQHTAAIRSELANRYASSTANKMLAALRGVLKVCWRLAYMDAELYHRTSDIAVIKGSALPAGRSLSVGELRALFLVCIDDQSAAGRRDAALLAILYGAGLRRSEVVTLNISDYEFSTGALRVRGKGGKERITYIPTTAQETIADWIELRGKRDGPLLFPVAKAGKIREGKRLSAQAVYGILRKRTEEAGIPHLSPHDLRRTFVGDLLDAGADISIVQKLAGHSHVSTTQKYDRRPEERKRKAADLLHIPYKNK